MGLTFLEVIEMWKLVGPYESSGPTLSLYR